MIITFYNAKINQSVVTNQKKVFEHFNIELNQIDCGQWIGHGKVIDKYLRECNQDWEYLILFDIDSIPLNEKIIPETIDWIKNNHGLFSVAQKASHIKDSIVYAGPCFLGFSRETYELMGRPSFDQTHRSDCAAELTYFAIDKGFEVKLMYPSSVEVPMWDLEDGVKFGYGTTYENNIYHSFESRFHNIDMFINKCDKVLNNNG